MTRPLRIGISPCPNDTFAFHGLLEHRIGIGIDTKNLAYEITLLDIEQLNERMLASDFDVCKTSFAAALAMADDIVVLPSGSALGFGVGPLLLAATPDTRPQARDQCTLCPGTLTTASFLFSLFYPDTTRVEQAVFSEIMPRLESRSADFGVCIHEGRFTWKVRGLSLVEDLGVRWEQETGCPLPLGGIVANRNLPHDTLAAVQKAIHDSLHLALASPAEVLPTMRRHAQEFDDRVLMQHVELYVNEWTRNLGDTGRRALAELSRRAKNAGLGSGAALSIFEG